MTIMSGGLRVAAIAIAAVIVLTEVVPQAQTAGPSGSASALNIPNASLVTHEKQKVRFYDDLVKGRIVLMNFMFTSCVSICPQATVRLRAVQDMLAERGVRNVLMLSVSVDPATDTPDVLARYAARHGVKPGWLFLTGNEKEVNRVRTRFGASDTDDADPSQHTGMLVFGNEPLGHWRMINVTRPATTITDAVARLAAGRLW